MVGVPGYWTQRIESSRRGKGLARVL